MYKILIYDVKKSIWVNKDIKNTLDEALCVLRLLESRGFITIIE